MAPAPHAAATAPPLPWSSRWMACVQCHHTVAAAVPHCRTSAHAAAVACAAACTRAPAPPLALPSTRAATPGLPLLIFSQAQRHYLNDHRLACTAGARTLPHRLRAPCVPRPVRPLAPPCAAHLCVVARSGTRPVPPPHPCACPRWSVVAAFADAVCACAWSDRTARLPRRAVCEYMCIRRHEGRRLDHGVGRR